MEALVRIGLVMTFFILIGILHICNGVSEHAPTLDPSTAPHSGVELVPTQTTT